MHQVPMQSDKCTLLMPTWTNLTSVATCEAQQQLAQAPHVNLLLSHWIATPSPHHSVKGKSSQRMRADASRAKSVTHFVTRGQIIYIYISIFIYIYIDIYIFWLWHPTLYLMFSLATQTASRQNRRMNAKERKKWTATRVGRAVAGYFPGILG